MANLTSGGDGMEPRDRVTFALSRELRGMIDRSAEVLKVSRSAVVRHATEAFTRALLDGPPREQPEEP